MKIRLNKSPTLLEEQTTPSFKYAFVLGDIDSGSIIASHNANMSFHGASMRKPLWALANLTLRKGHQRLSEKELSNLLGYAESFKNASNIVMKALSGTLKNAPKGWPDAMERQALIKMKASEVRGVMTKMGLPNLGKRMGSWKQTAMDMYKFMAMINTITDNTYVEANGAQIDTVVEYMTREYVGARDSDRESKGMRALQHILNQPQNFNGGIQSIWGKGGFNRKKGTPSSQKNVYHYALVINDKYILVVYTQQPAIGERQTLTKAKAEARVGLANIVIAALKGAQGKGFIQLVSTRPQPAKKKQSLVNTLDGAPKNIRFFPGSTGTCGTVGMKKYIDTTLAGLGGMWCVGDVSACPGGKVVGPHRAHKLGVDTDIALPMVGGACSINTDQGGTWGRDKKRNIFKDISPEQLDVKRALGLLVATLPTARVMIIDKKFHPLLMRTAQDLKMPPKVYKLLFGRSVDKEVSDKSQSFGRVIHDVNHESHFHISLSRRFSKASGQPSSVSQTWQKSTGRPERCHEFRDLDVSEVNYKVEKTTFKQFMETFPEGANFADLYCRLEKIRVQYAFKTLEELMTKYGTKPNYIFDDGHLKLFSLAMAHETVEAELGGDKPIPDIEVGRKYQELINQLRDKKRVWTADTLDCGGNDSECGHGKECVWWPARKTYTCQPKGVPIQEISVGGRPKKIQLSIRKTNYQRSLLESNDMKTKKMKVDKNLLKENIKLFLLKNPELLQKLMEAGPDPKKEVVEQGLKGLEKFGQSKMGQALKRIFIGTGRAKEEGVLANASSWWSYYTKLMGYKGVHLGSGGPLLTRTLGTWERVTFSTYMLMTIAGGEPEWEDLLQQVWWKISFGGVINWLLDKHGIPFMSQGLSSTVMDRSAQAQKAGYPHWTGDVGDFFYEAFGGTADPQGDVPGAYRRFKNAVDKADGLTKEEKKRGIEASDRAEEAFSQFNSLCMGDPAKREANKLKCAKLGAGSVGPAMRELDDYIGTVLAPALAGPKPELTPEQREKYSPEKPWFLYSNMPQAQAGEAVSALIYNWWVGSLCGRFVGIHGHKKGVTSWKKMISDPSNQFRGKAMAAWFERYVKLKPEFWPGGKPGATDIEMWTCPKLKPYQERAVFEKTYGINPEEK